MLLCLAADRCGLQGNKIKGIVKTVGYDYEPDTRGRNRGLLFSIFGPAQGETT